MSIYGREAKTDYIEPIVRDDIPTSFCEFRRDGYCRVRIAYYAGEHTPIIERCIYCGESPKEHCPVCWCYAPSARTEKGGER